MRPVNGYCSQDNQLHRIHASVRAGGWVLGFSYSNQSTAGGQAIGDWLPIETEHKPHKQTAKPPQLDDWWVERIWEWDGATFRDITNDKSKGLP